MAERQNSSELKDLQVLLSKTLGDEVTIISQKSSSLPSIGESFGGTILKLDVVIKRSGMLQEESFDLVAKTIVKSDLKNVLDHSSAFAKEIIIFEKVIPEYLRLEVETGCSYKYAGNFIPKYYGGRLTRIPDHPMVADEDAVILMKNIKNDGYTIKDKKIGLDFEHSKAALLELARFHSLGIALRCKKPLLFHQFEEILSLSPINTESDYLTDVAEKFLNVIFADSRIAKYKERLTKNILKYNWTTMTKMSNSELWTSILHNDFWVNNIMFQKNNGKINGIKFIDFQLSKVGNVQSDVSYFCTSIRPNILAEHLDDLLDAYYNRLIEVLRDLGCESSKYTRKNFNEQLKIEAKTHLFHSLIAIKFFMYEAPEGTKTENIKDSILISEGSKIFLDRAWNIICMYLQMDWL